MAIDRIALLGIDIIVNAQRARTALKSIDQSMNKMNGLAGDLGVALGAVGVAFSGLLLARRFTTVAVEGITIVTKAAATLEEQIRDIEKITSSGSINELARQFLELGQNIRGLSFDDISKGAQTAARSGVTLGDGLIKLTDITSRYAMVAGDLTPTDATEGIARLLANFDMGVEKADNVTSSINGLSDAFSTTSGEIQKTMARLSGFAEATNMTIEELAALSAAVLSSGQSATVVRSTIGALLDKLAKEPEVVREQLKMTNEEFEQFFLLLRSDPTTGILKFIERLNSMDPLEQAKALEALGVSSFRIASTIKIMQAAYEKLIPAIELSNKLFEEGTVNLDKYAVVAEGTNAKLKQLHNQWTVLKASLSENTVVLNHLIGGFEILKGLLEGFQTHDFTFSQFKMGDTVTELDRQIYATEQQILRLQSVIDQKLNPATQHDPTTPNNIMRLLGITPSMAYADIFDYIKKEAGFLLGEYPQALGIIKDLEFQINLLKEKRQTIIENEGEAIERNIERTKQQQEAAEKAAKALRERQLEQFKEFQKELEDIGYTGAEAKIKSLENEIDELRKKFEDLHKPTDELTKAYEEAVGRLRKQVDDIKAQPTGLQNDRLDFLSKFSGRFGDAVEEVDALLKGMNLFKGVPQIQNTINSMLNSFLNPPNLPRFISTDQAQQDIREAALIEERRKHEKDQLALAKAMVDVMITNANINQATHTLLERMHQEGNTIK